MNPAIGSDDPAPAKATGLTTAEADARAQEELLALAERWAKAGPGRVHHAVDAYTRVVALDPASAAAGEARQALLGIAGRWQKDGKVYMAANLYHLLARYYP